MTNSIVWHLTSLEHNRGLHLVKQRIILRKHLFITSKEHEGSQECVYLEGRQERSNPEVHITWKHVKEAILIVSKVFHYVCLYKLLIAFSSKEKILFTTVIKDQLPLLIHTHC